MTDKEKLDAVKAEILRLVEARGYSKEMANDLLTFMDSLPNEPVSEELEDIASQLTKTGEQIRAYESLTKASISTGISRTSILNNLSGKSKSAGGFVWKKV